MLLRYAEALFIAGGSSSLSLINARVEGLIGRPWGDLIIEACFNLDAVIYCWLGHANHVECSLYCRRLKLDSAGCSVDADFRRLKLHSSGCSCQLPASQVGFYRVYVLFICVIWFC